MMEADCGRERVVGMEADKRLRVRFYKAVWVTEKPLIYTLSEWERSLAIVQIASDRLFRTRTCMSKGSVRKHSRNPGWR